MFLLTSFCCHRVSILFVKRSKKKKKTHSLLQATVFASDLPVYIDSINPTTRSMYRNHVSCELGTEWLTGGVNSSRWLALIGIGMIWMSSNKRYGWQSSPWEPGDMLLSLPLLLHFRPECENGGIDDILHSNWNFRQNESEVDFLFIPLMYHRGERIWRKDVLNPCLILEERREGIWKPNLGDP